MVNCRLFFSLNRVGTVAARAVLCCALLAISAPGFANPDKAARFYEDGLARYERNDLAGAVIQLKNALQNDKSLLAAHLLLGKALLRSGDVAGAEASFDQALKQGVSRAEVAVPLARMYMLLGRAQAVLDRIPAEGLPGPVQAEVLSIRGSAYAERGKPIEADKSFAAARQIDPKSAHPYIAEVPVRLLAGQTAQALAAAQAALSLAPSNPEVLNLHASVLHATRDLDGALKSYSRAIELSANHIDARIARASIYLDKQKTNEARADLDALKTISPKEPRASYLRSVLASRLGDGNTARQALLETARNLESLPREWVAAREQFMMLGALSYHGLGQSQKARAYLDTLVNKSSKNGSARKLLASIYLEENEHVRAASSIEPWLRDHPDDAQALYLLGQAQMGQRRYAQAMKTLERAAQLGASTPEVHAAIGFSKIGLGQQQQGIRSLEVAFAAKPGDPKIGFALASQYLRQGAGHKAVATAESMVKKDPQNLASLNLLGVVKAAAGDRAGARVAYEQVLALDGKFEPAHLNLARLDSVEGRRPDAKKRLDSLLAAQRNNTDVMYELGQLDLHAGRASDAVRWFEKAYAINPRDLKIGTALAEAHLSLGAYDPAVGTAKQLAIHFADNVEVRGLLARAQIAQGDKGGAVQTFRELTKLADYDPALQTRIGQLQLSAGLIDGASYNAQKALAGAPTDEAAMSLACEVEIARGDYAKAETAAKNLLAKHSASAGGHRLLGDIALARRQFRAAESAYAVALSRQPSTDHVLRVARAQLLAGDTGKAKSSLEQWLSKQSNDLAARGALAEIHMRTASWNAARDQYEKILSVEKEQAHALNNLAQVQLKLRDPQSVSTAQRALKASPNDPNVADTLGWVLVQHGQLDAGLRYLREARLRQPEDANLRYHLAYALAKSGRTAEAKGELEYALKSTAFEEIASARQLQAELSR